MSRRSSKKVVDHYLAGEVAKLAGLSRHMIDYLCRHGVLTASVSGKRGYGVQRQFNFADILLARTIRELLDSGVSVLAMKRALRTLRGLLESGVPASLRDTGVVIRGGVPYLAEPGEAPIDLLSKGQLAFSFVLDVEQLWNRATRVHAKREANTRDRIKRALALRQRRLA